MTPLSSGMTIDPGMIAAALAKHGLILRGGFSFETLENAPLGPTGSPARAALLIGQAGASIWPHLQHWNDDQPEAASDPLDTWSRNVIGDVARRFGSRAVFPFEKPFLPFQQWAMRAEGLKPSPLGILMHPQYGLWHAYRGALLFDAEWPSAPVEPPVHLCDLCHGKPCLSACPIDAYSMTGFAYEACIGYLKSDCGEICMTEGCRARNACPYGEPYRYPSEVQAYHQARFAGRAGRL